MLKSLENENAKSDLWYQLISPITQNVAKLQKFFMNNY